MIRENHLFVFVLVTAGFTAATLILNVREPLKDPIQAQPTVTSTPWAVPVLASATITPPLPGQQGGWWSRMPTPAPIKTRLVVPSNTPTITKMPKK